VGFDQVADATRWRFGLFVTASVVTLIWVTMAVIESGEPWEAYQAELASSGLWPRSVNRGVLEVDVAMGSQHRTDRCRSCHLGMELEAEPGAQRQAPHTAHPGRLLTQHSPEQHGCAICHGGTAQALEPSVAHALVGTTQHDPMMQQPYVQASCIQCHLPGAVVGSERLARGARLYLTLGCGMCHSLKADGRGGWDYGPDLRRMGRHGDRYLRQSLLDPAANFAGTTMPSYQSSLGENPEILSDLLTYLHALTLPRLKDPGIDGLYARPCTTCHAGLGGAAVGTIRHQCVWINEEQEQLRCQSCHTGELPVEVSFAGFCPVVREHRGGCLTCHTGYGG